VHLRTRDESLVRLCTRLSMFDGVARACLSLMLPGWLLRLCLTGSMCACAQWLLCCALAHEALLLTFVVIITVVIVVVAIARHDVEMPSARAQGLIIDIRHRHCCSCCRCCRQAM
jgi:hypothetical protein